MEKFLFLHVPHTGGRVISRYCFFNCIGNYLGKIHNDQITDIDLTSFSLDEKKVYFILRHPIERLIAEYEHYSHSLLTNFQVNDINQEIFSSGSDFQKYCKIEKVKNRYVKFLLLLIRPNYKFGAEEITDETFQQVLEFLDPRSNNLRGGRICFDLFENEDRPVFFSLIHQGENLRSGSHSEGKSMKDIRKMYLSQTAGGTGAGAEENLVAAREANKYDILLFERLTELTNNTA